MPSVSKKQQQAMAISPQYVAGFLDGEGNITILQRNRCSGGESYNLIIGLTNRDLRVLTAIQSVYGGSIFAKKRYSTQHSVAFELRLAKRSQVNQLLNDVIPYLICKRQQAELGLAFLAMGRVKREVVGRRKFHPTKGGTVPLLRVVAGEQETRRAMKAELSKLNQRGVA